MSVDISVSITEDIVDIIATPTVNIVNVTNSASINPGLYDLSEFTNTSVNPFTRTNSFKTVEGVSIIGAGDIDITKASVGLGNADNTSDLNKPISTATQTALNAKQATLVSGTNIKTINGSSVLGSGNLTISGGVTDVTASAPLVSSGGTTPDISMDGANGGNDGFLKSDDWNKFNDKQTALVSGTNIKTINGSSVLGSGNLVVGGGGGLQGVHALLGPSSGFVVSNNLSPTGLGSTIQAVNRMMLAPFIPAKTFTSSNLLIRVFLAVASSLAKILIYSDLNGKPDTLLFQSTDIDCSTTGTKTITTSFTFTAGNIYWLSYWGNLTPQVFTIASANMITLRSNGSVPSPSNIVSVIIPYGSAPSTLTGTAESIINMPFIGITQA